VVYDGSNACLLSLSMVTCLQEVLTGFQAFVCFLPTLAPILMVILIGVGQCVPCLPQEPGIEALLLARHQISSYHILSICVLRPSVVTRFRRNGSQSPAPHRTCGRVGNQRVTIKDSTFPTTPLRTEHASFLCTP